jgi:hypothetical protein
VSEVRERKYSYAGQEMLEQIGYSAIGSVARY